MNNIEKQYKTAGNLNTRISIHEKYSTNRQPFGDWIISNYEMQLGFQILELGCGTADMWKENLHAIPECARLVLTDFSEGMLDAARENTRGCAAVEFCRVDIQAIPFPDNSFDMVIANMMLYHVPDLHKGLSEVRRVLKPGGKFYCATYGERGIMEFISDTLRDLNISGSIGKTFTLQNGGESLRRHFDHVQKLTREDGLAITHIPDFVDYVLSMTSLTGLENATAEVLLQAFKEKCINGILYVPKEYGMFICK